MTFSWDASVVAPLIVATLTMSRNSVFSSSHPSELLSHRRRARRPCSDRHAICRVTLPAAPMASFALVRAVVYREPKSSLPGFVLASSHAAVWPLNVVSTVMAAFDPGVAGGHMGGGQGGVACGKEGGS